MSDADQHLMTLFSAALDQPSEADRAAYLEEACAQSPALRARVEALLRAHAGAGRFLEPSPAESPTIDRAASLTDAAHRPEAGEVVAGRYRLLEVIGEGGMGTVWRAEQTEPVRRRVALKVIKAGMDSRQILARFEAERQALALMDHPNIARVLDAGATADGRPFFVMELVEGVSITRYCDEARLTPRQRLVLYVTICQAVQHAHQKGIIHRDLKPSNVLVGQYDGRAVPKVIDFGVAKAAGQPLIDETLFTGFGAVVGTPEYMSPEQAELSNQDVDTRSDVYSLGVLLYELLTGSTPLTHRRAQEVGLLEVLRLIREEEPPRPSVRLSSTQELPAVSASRQTEPARLTRLVRGELDWIVMKCLEKDRGRRYETANGLARDVERYLSDEPVAAGPPSRWYRARKFLRRNKGPAFAAGLLALTFCAGLAGITWKWLDADHRKTQWQNATAEAEQATRDEQAARKDLQKALYDQTIALAYHEWLSGNPGRAEQLIDECRPEYRGWEWYYVRRLCHSARLTLAGNADTLNMVAWSPDGRLLAGATGWYEKQTPGEVIVWDATSGKTRLTLKGHTRVVRSVAFSRTGRYLASSGVDTAVGVWDVTTGKRVAWYPGRGGGWIRGVAFSPVADLLAATDGPLLRVWDVAADRELFSITNESNLCGVAFSPDGQLVAASCHSPADVKIWDVRTRAEVRRLRGHAGEASSVAFSNDGRRLVSGGWDYKIKIWDVTAGREIRTIHDHTDVVGQACFSPDGKFVASASWDGTVRLWDSDSGAEVRSYRGHTGLVNSVAFSPDGETLASAGADHRVKVWDVMTQLESRRLSLPHGHPYALAFSADGKLLAAADGSVYVGTHKSLTLYDARTGLTVRTLRGHTGRVLGVAFSPRGPLVASGGTDRTVRLWDAVTGRVLHVLSGHDGDVTGVAFSHDGRLVASSSADRTVRIWDVETGRGRRVLRGHTDAVTGVAFAADGRIASSSADRTVRLWDAEGAPGLVLEGHTGAVTGVAFRPDGLQLASASADQTLRIWDAAGGTPLFVLKGHTEEVRSLAYGPKGDRLVSASKDDGTVRLWDVNGGRQLLALRHPGHQRGVQPRRPVHRLGHRPS
jgi:WD40 repeat protein/serine/threonine protein kinase